MRKIYLDYLRAFAIIGVICTHVTVKYYGDSDLFGTATWWMANIINASSRFAVPLFIMISGAVLLGKSQPVTEFYQKRAWRILPPWIFWSLAFLIFNYVFTGDLYSLIWFLKGGILIQGNTTTHLWYLSMFACLMLFAPYINKIILNEPISGREVKILCGIVLAFLLLNELDHVYTQLKDKPIQWFKTFIWFVPYFIGGYLIDRYSDQLRLSGSYIVLAILASLGLGIAMNYEVAARLGLFKDYLILGNDGLLIYVITFGVFILARRHMAEVKANKVIGSLSEASFGIYLLHPAFIFLINRYILSGNISSYGVSGLIAIAMTIFVTLLLSWLSIWLIRKQPVLRAIA
jgi:surface polysaccharide O-acyltransferase-like enzyme